MQTPFFLIDKDKLQNNTQAFFEALKKYWPNSRLSYSVKTNSLPWVLEYLNQYNVMAEVVSDEEYILAKECGYKPHEIVFNGPIKGEKTFLEAVRNKSIVNIDSKKELNWFIENSISYNQSLGIRINIPTDIFNLDDIEYFEDGFRFGFSETSGDILKAIDVITNNSRNNPIGLHFHCNSITRSLSVYKRISQYAAYLIKKYDLSLSYIDIGGGFFGGVENKPTPFEYIQVIYDELKDVVDVKETTLIVEPGSAIIGSAIDLYTTVVDIKDTDRSKIITTDGSRIHIDPLWKKEKYLYTLQLANGDYNIIPTQLICGYTCMDHDRIMKICDQPELQIGDRIIYHKVGAYTVTFGGPFIKFWPEVFVSGNGKFEKIRKAIYVDDYLKIQSIQG